MTPAAVLFDLEGVLLQGRSTPDGVYSAAVDSLLDPETVTEAEKRTLVSPDDFESYRDLCRRIGVDPERFWADKEDAASALETEYVGDTRELTADAATTLSALDSRGVRIGIVSNNSQAVVDYVVSYFDLESVVEVWYGLENTIAGFERRKPDPHYLERALEEMGLDGGRTYYVGDRRSDLEAAQAAGVTPVLLCDDPDRFDTALDALPGRRIRSLSELLANSG